MFWFSAALHLFSSGQILRNDCSGNCCSFDLKSNKINCDNCCGYRIHYTRNIGISILFHLFGCYWATQFIIACSSTVIAGSVASYYWARGEISVSKAAILAVWDSGSVYIYAGTILHALKLTEFGNLKSGSVVKSLITSEIILVQKWSGHNLIEILEVLLHLKLLLSGSWGS